jgi:hypothetical protein
MTIELDVEAPQNKTKEEVEGFAYWLIEPFLEDTKTDTYNVDGCQVKNFNIEIN